MSSGDTISKAVVQTWLGAALTVLAPAARISGSSRRPEELLAEGDPPSQRVALIECVGSVPKVRFARSSQIDKAQLAAYAQERAFAEWRGRIFFVLGHPPDNGEARSAANGDRYLQCIGLSDAVAHVGRTGRGTINSELLEALRLEPSITGSHPVALSVAQMVALVIASDPIRPSAQSGRQERDWEGSRRPFAWWGRPMPLGVALPI